MIWPEDLGSGRPGSKQEGNKVNKVNKVNEVNKVSKVNEVNEGPMTRGQGLRTDCLRSRLGAQDWVEL